MTQLSSIQRNSTRLSLPATSPIHSADEAGKQDSIAASQSPTEVDELPPTAVAAPPANPLDSPIIIEHPGTPTTAGQVASLHAPKMFVSPLRGSHESLVRQNERSEADDLERIEDDVDLADRIARGVLVPVPESAGVVVNPVLPPDRRYCRPWTAAFLTDLGRAHQAQFRTPITVSSAVRTVAYQKHLMRVNRNAADAEGDIVSPHVTGATIDIAKSGLSRHEILWMRDHLLPLQDAGKIDVEEEFHQACFHITVYKNYVPGTPGPRLQKLVAPTDNTPDTQSVVNDLASPSR